jgi:apolipoprotein N-acyltransferase
MNDSVQQMDPLIPEDQETKLRFLKGTPVFLLFSSIVWWLFYRMLDLPSDLTWMLLIVMNLLGIILWIAVAVAYFVRRRNQLKNEPNQASHATSKPAPGADSSAHGG